MLQPENYSENVTESEILTLVTYYHSKDFPSPQGSVLGPD